MEAELNKRKWLITLGILIILVIAFVQVVPVVASGSVTVTSTITNHYADGTSQQSAPAPITALTVQSLSGKVVVSTDVLFMVRVQASTVDKSYAKDVTASYTLTQKVSATGQETPLQNRQTLYSFHLTASSPDGAFPVSTSIPASQLFPTSVSEMANSTVTWALTAYASFGATERQVSGSAIAKYTWLNGKPVAMVTITSGSGGGGTGPTDGPSDPTLKVTVTPTPGVVRYGSPTSLTAKVVDDKGVAISGAQLTWKNYNGYFPAGLAIATSTMSTGADGSATATFYPDIVGFNVVVVTATYGGRSALGYCVVYCLHEGSWGVEPDGGVAVTVQVQKPDGSPAGSETMLVIDRQEDPAYYPWNPDWGGVIRLPSSGVVTLWLPMGFPCKASALYVPPKPTVPGGISGQWGLTCTNAGSPQTFTPKSGLGIIVTRAEYQWTWIPSTPELRIFPDWLFGR